MPAPNQLPIAPFGALPTDAMAKIVPLATAPLAASSAAAIGATGASWAMWLGWSSVWLKSGHTMMSYAAHETPKTAKPAVTKPAVSAKPAAPVKKAPKKTAKPAPAVLEPAPTVKPVLKPELKIVAKAEPKSTPTVAPEPEPKAPSAPVPPAAAAPAKLVTTRPMALDSPKHGKADDLKLVSGVGPKLEIVLNDLGIYHFDQIASWTKPEIDWVDDYLSFSGRIERDDWVAQAKSLAAGSS
ncbi:MAG: hypothetical protein AAGD23_03645 [Pseudomonadota bacterium]